MSAQPEHGPENRVPVQFKYEKPVPGGAQVQLQYSLDGKSWEFHPLHKSGNAFVGNTSLPEGTNYQYRFWVISADGMMQPDPAKFGETLKGTVTAGAQTAPDQQNQSNQAPHQPNQAPRPENVVNARSEVIRRRLQGRVKDILGAGRSYEGVENLETLFEQIDLEMQEINHTGNISPIILGILGEEIGNLPNLPVAIRNRFKGKPPPQSYEELEQRFSEGGTIFRRKVFNSLKANPAAQKALGIKPGSADFSDPGMRKIFKRVCNEFDMWETIPFLGMAFGRLTETPPANNPELTKQRMKLLKGILGRLKPRQQSMVGKMPADKQAVTIEMALNTGYWGTALLAGAPLVAASVWLGKGALEGTTGIHTKDIMQAMKEPTKLTALKNLWEVFKKNNIVSQWGESQEGLGGLLKKKVKGFLLGSIPFYGPWKAAQGQKEEPTFGPESAKVKPTEKPAEVEDIMREACTKELGT